MSEMASLRELARRFILADDRPSVCYVRGARLLNGVGTSDIEHTLSISSGGSGKRSVMVGNATSLSFVDGYGISAVNFAYSLEVELLNEVCSLCGMEPWVYDTTRHKAAGMNELIVPWLTFLAARARLREQAIE